MKALVVGASGQLGAALVSLLDSCGVQVAGTHCSRPKPESLHLDIRDRDEVRLRILTFAPDLIFLAQNTVGQNVRTVVVDPRGHGQHCAGSGRVKIRTRSSK